MKKRHWTDEEVKKALSDMPKIDDTQEKEALYRNISERLNDVPLSKPSKKRRHRWVPVFSFVATALILLLIAIPLIPSDEESYNLADEAVPEIQEVQPFSGAQDAPKGERQQPIERRATGDQRESAVERSMMRMPLAEEHVIRSIPTGSEVVTVPYIDPSAQFIVPVSYTVQDGETTEQMEQIYAEADQLASDEAFGLGASLLENVEIEKNDDKRMITLNFSQEKATQLNQGSTASTLLVLSLEEAFGSSFDFVRLQTEGQPGLSLGNFGTVEELELINQKPRPYFIYETDATRFLIAMPSHFSEPALPESFDEALQFMKTPPDVLPGVSSALEPVEIQEATLLNETATVTFANLDSLNSNENLDQLQWMIEAILMTAKEYGAVRVQFEGAQGAQIGPYALNQPIEVPVAANRHDALKQDE
ncbi:hypothetical protein G4V62_01355 [Bacillaceae bacterium SIJ1]|uniref:hypothetical protein n=1 Tax=Litoribacterium kuwaitense TaxID=1398745 RepID=UPI0013EAF6BE|nr:hypothetical protein [Litoribacterium kuwaitense]NGP43673.1 hypothetical protein [Litoribacterium kuwaitense]